MRPDAPVHWHDVIDSTNEEARRLTQSGSTGPLWIAARQQTAGRGRLGRSWVSPVGNLFATALFEESGGFKVATRHPFASGLAIADMCRALLPEVDIRLKWPNDVRVDGAKLCGILVEAGTSSDGATWVASGMGVNIAFAPEGAGQAATCLAELGGAGTLSPDLVLEVLRPAFAKRVAQAREDFAATLRDWELVAEGIGQTVVSGKDDKAVRGIFTGLAEDGGLRLALPDGSEHIIRAGDVELVKEIGSDAARN